MSFDLVDDGATVTVGLIGEIDVSCRDWAFDVIRRAAANRRALVIDLRRVAFMDAAGLSLLLSVDHWSAGQDCRLVLRQPSHFVRRVIEVVCLQDYFHIEHRSQAE